MATELRPWGRFACISVDPAAESNHLYFYKKVNRIGRGRVDIVIDQTFISRVHCIVSIDDIDNGVDGGPGYSVVLLDESRSGVYVNEVRVGKSQMRRLEHNYTIHFTTPGVRRLTPLVYKFELLQEGLTPENTRLRNEVEVRAQAARAQAARAQVPRSQATPTTTLQGMATQATAPATPSSVTSIPATQEMATQAAATPSSTTSIASAQDTVTPSNKRRVRDREDDADVTGASIMISAESRVSGSSSKKKRRMIVSDHSGGSDSGIEDDELNTSATMQRVNHELRRKLQESSNTTVQLRKELADAVAELVALRGKLRASEADTNKLQQELDDKVQQEHKHAEEIEQLKQEKSVLETANNKLNAQTARATELENEKKASDAKAAMVTFKLNAEIERNVELEAKVKALEAANRDLEVANFSVQKLTTVVEEKKRDVEEEKLVMANSLREAFKLFEIIKKQVLYGEKLPGIPLALEELERRRRRIANYESSMSTEPSQDDSRHLTDTSLISSEHSQPTPVNSSDINTQDIDEEETQQLPAGSQVEETQDEDPTRKDGSEESTASGPSSASKTPPTVPSIQFQPTPMQKNDEEEAGDAPHDAKEKYDEEKTVVDDGDNASAPKISQQENNAAPGGEVNEEETKGNDEIGGGEQTDKAHDDENQQESREEEEESGDGKEKGDDKEDDNEDEEEEKAGDEVIDEEEETVVEVSAQVEDEETKTPSVTQQRWLSSIVSNNDESIDSQANASEGGDNFDDETQLSQ